MIHILLSVVSFPSISSPSPSFLPLPLVFHRFTILSSFFPLHLSPSHFIPYPSTISWIYYPFPPSFISILCSPPTSSHCFNSPLLKLSPSCLPPAFSFHTPSPSLPPPCPIRVHVLGPVPHSNNCTYESGASLVTILMTAIEFDTLSLLRTLPHTLQMTWYSSLSSS